MYSECLPFSRVPHTTPLFSAFMHEFSRVGPFYRRPPLQTAWLAEECSSIRYEPGRRAQVSAILERQNRGFGSFDKTLRNIDRLRAGACAAVTGQQVGLFGGPIFALLKAITAVRLAEAATQSGVDCVPIFWLATEDHDLDEVSHVTVPGGDGLLHRLSTPTEALQNAPVGDIRFGDEIEPVVAKLADLLGSSDVVDWVRAAYRPGMRFGDAFGVLFARLFQDCGVILIDAGDPELHAIAAPLYAEAVRRAEPLDRALLARGEELRHGGFHEQVKVTPSSTMLFALENGARTVIHRSNGNFSIGERKLSEQELLASIAAAPAQFSANVLLRPVVEDYLLPTLAYIGGPAEVAYFAQADVVYKELTGRTTPVWPRISATVIEPHVKRLLDRYKISVTDAFQDPESVRELLAARSLPADLQQNFDKAVSSLDASLQAITESLDRLDHTLVDAAARSGAKMRYQLDSLRNRAARSELRRSEVIERHARQFSSALFPDRTLQERVIGGVYLLGRYPDLLQTLHDHASLTCPDHQVMFL